MIFSTCIFWRSAALNKSIIQNDVLFQWLSQRMLNRKLQHDRWRKQSLSTLFVRMCTKSDRTSCDGSRSSETNRWRRRIEARFWLTGTRLGMCTRLEQACILALFPSNFLWLPLRLTVEKRLSYASFIILLFFMLCYFINLLFCTFKPFASVWQMLNMEKIWFCQCMFLH